jgi:hydrogenase nickel incorporation protein HypA/HybF
MHESSIARQLLSAALERANAEGAARIVTVRGWIADCEELSRESLALHFAAHARGSPAEGAALDIRLTRVSARCGRCGEEYPPPHHLTLCPKCGSTDAALLGQTGLGIDSIEIEPGDA